VLLAVTVHCPPVIAVIGGIAELVNQQLSGPPPPGSCSVTLRPVKWVEVGNSVWVHLPIVGKLLASAHHAKAVVSPVGVGQVTCIGREANATEEVSSANGRSCGGAISL